MQVLPVFGIHQFRSLVIALMFEILSGSAMCQTRSLQISTQDTELREQYEDRVAQMFESIRQDSGLPHLARIRRRHDLEQLVCTAAVNDANPSGNVAAELMYRTSDPRSPTKELEQIARFKDLEENPMPPWTRYAVPAWPATDTKSKRLVWWVGIGIYWSAFFEWFDNNLTDDRPYRNDWKKLVTSACRDVR